MLSAEAHVETERPSRYLVQLCRHFNHKGRHLRHRSRTHPGGDAHERPDGQVHVEWSDAHGIVTFGWGQCTMQATADTLTLRAEATDEENLRRVQDLVAGHLDRFAKHDHLEVNWQRPETPTVAPGEATGAAPAPTGADVARRQHRRTIIGLTAAAALVIAVHLGLGGAVLAASRWTSLAGGIVLAVVLVKVIGVTVIALRYRGVSSRVSKAPGRWGSPRMSLPRLASSARSSASRGEDGGGTR